MEEERKVVVKGDPDNSIKIDSDGLIRSKDIRVFCYP
jgi:hypothetical protein